jgi:hypothetical protein
MSAPRQPTHELKGPFDTSLGVPIMTLVSIIIVASVALTGCATLQRSSAANTERLLTAAGFQMQPADTAEQQQVFGAMPANRLRNRPHGDSVEYWYADPTSCRCVYVGGPREYAAYQRLRTQQQNAQERLRIEENAINWAPWAHGYSEY